MMLRYLFCARWNRAVGWRTPATVTRARHCRSSTVSTSTATSRPRRRSWSSSVWTNSSERRNSRAGSESDPRSGCFSRNRTPHWRPRFDLSVRSWWHTVQISTPQAGVRKSTPISGANLLYQLHSTQESDIGKYEIRSFSRFSAPISGLCVIRLALVLRRGNNWTIRECATRAPSVRNQTCTWPRWLTRYASLPAFLDYVHAFFSWPWPWPWPSHIKAYYFIVLKEGNTFIKCEGRLGCALCN